MLSSLPLIVGHQRSHQLLVRCVGVNIQWLVWRVDRVVFAISSCIVINSGTVVATVAVRTVLAVVSAVLSWTVLPVIFCAAEVDGSKGKNGKL